MSQAALAAAAQMEESGLSRLENGKGGYSQEGIERIAEALKVSVGVLFADNAVVEAAAMRMREIPILSPDQLAQWRGAESLDFNDDQEFLYIERGRVSRHCFAMRVADLSNGPAFLIGDELVLEADAKKKAPEMGSFVVAQDSAGVVTLGRFRPLPVAKGEDPAYEVVPSDSLYPVASSKTAPELELRGVLVEFRRQVP